jgi:hypothetical protein
MGGWFDELRDIMYGLHGNRDGVVAEPPPVGLMPLPHLVPAVADVYDPRLDPVLPCYVLDRHGAR